MLPVCSTHTRFRQLSTTCSCIPVPHFQTLDAAATVLYYPHGDGTKRL